MTRSSKLAVLVAIAVLGARGRAEGAVALRHQANQVGDFVGLAGPFHGHHLVDDLGAETSLGHGGVYDARRHGIDCDIAAGQLARERFG